VKHAYRRAAGLARSLFVIDEVHASDRLVTAIGTALRVQGAAAGCVAPSARLRFMSGIVQTSWRLKWRWVSFRIARSR
jgi:hypothetical protein